MSGVRRAGEGGGLDQMGGVDRCAVEKQYGTRCPPSSDSWPDPMLDPDLQRQLPALAERIRKNFDHSDWIAVGAMTGCLDQVEGHHRLLRSLSFRDADYRGHIIVVLSRIVESDPQFEDYL